jgi:hypothetical protein
MKTIYLIEKSEGQWEDRRDWVDRAYLSEEEANAYILKYNIKLRILKETVNNLWKKKK